MQMEGSIKTYHLEITSLPESIVEVENFVEGLRGDYNIGDDVYGNILISLTEAVNNAIIHGNKMDASKKVHISCNIDERKLTFVVEDEGKGFDFNHLPDPTDPENLEKLTGRGVFLMKQLSDFVIYSNQGSTVEIQFKI